MDRQLKIFLEDKSYFSKFKHFIETQTSITEIVTDSKGEKRIEYQFKGNITQIISTFLRNDANKTFIKKFERNEPAEKSYMKLIPQRSFLHKGRKQGEYTSRDNTKDIKNIFKSIFREDIHNTSIIKQYMGRYQHIIEKEYFTEEQIEIINIGVFFLMIVYYIAKQEKTATQSGAEKSEPKDSLTKKTELDSVLNKPQYVGYGPSSTSLSKDRDYWKLINNYLGNDQDFENLTPERRQNFQEWLEKNRKIIENMPQFNESIQEGTHSVLYLGNEKDDAFTEFLFNTVSCTRPFVKFPYFFEGSTKKELKINGKKTNIIVYAKPLEMNTQLDLNNNLKPIWFRDITNHTKESKKYTKLSMEEAHETAASYQKLLNNKIIKFIEITYQAKENGIYVSFKTNNFEIPPIVLKDDAFKTLYKKLPDRILYRGLQEDHFKREAHTLFKKLKEKGVSYNITKHNNQRYGPGVYWTKDIEKAKKYGTIIVMGFIISDFPVVLEELLHDLNKEHLNTFLMRDNQCIMIREKAISTVPSSKLSEELKQEYEKYDIVVLDTEEKIKNWLQCKD